jgi:hypothetical protein
MRRVEVCADVGSMHVALFAVMRDVLQEPA